MSRFSVDLTKVAADLSKRSYKFAEVSHRFEKVGFDVFRKVDGNPEELWQVESGIDGDYIVAIYDEEETVKTASAKPWTITVKQSDLHIFYKGSHLCKVAASELGLQDADLSLVKSYLPKKLASNPNLVRSLLKTLEEDNRKSIVAKYPELS